jgi:hypothetical protein
MSSQAKDGLLLSGYLWKCRRNKKTVTRIFSGKLA